MGLSFAKSIKVGAVRFNFSGSGIGMSVGIPGLRVGTGPRGAYISGGVAGFRYRKSLGTPARASARTPAPANQRTDAAQEHVALGPNILSTQVHETKDVLELARSNGDELLLSMNEQNRRTPLWPATVLATLVCLFSVFHFTRGMADSVTGPALVLLAVLAVPLNLWVRWRDKLRRTTVLFFDPDGATNELFERLSTGLKKASGVQKLRSIATTSKYADTRYSAGAGQGMSFGEASLTLGQAPNVVANVPVPILKSGRTTLALYPDRILAFQGHAVGAIEYSRLSAVSTGSRFIEEEALPRDATVVGKTWRYVNKNGTPDRRFKDNRELPICAYNQLNLSTLDGFDMRFMASRSGCFDTFAESLAALAMAASHALEQARLQAQKAAIRRATAANSEFSALT